MALVSGISVLQTPDTYVSTSQASLLSPTGRSRAFDHKVDGYCRAEGCGVVLLKRLSDALRDGNRILATIRSTAVNTNGQNPSITRPMADTQILLSKTALASASVKPEWIDFIEGHFTGTPVGDPIEMTALTSVFVKNVNRSEPLIIGSVKSNIGHGEGAAGTRLQLCN
jgi:acyl transferase domain-containing protein